MIRLFVLLLLLVSGCASAPHTANLTENYFQRALSPLPGHALLYIFRPGFSKVSIADSPSVSVNGKEVFSLSFESYLNLNLQPGTYRIALSPRSSDSPVWNAASDIRVESGKTYYLAIWNNTETSSSTGIAFIPGGIPLVIPINSTSVRNRQVRFEEVVEEEALPVIEHCRLAKSTGDVFEPER